MNQELTCASCGKAVADHRWQVPCTPKSLENLTDPDHVIQWASKVSCRGKYEYLDHGFVHVASEGDYRVAINIARAAKVFEAYRIWRETKYADDIQPLKIIEDLTLSLHDAYKLI